MEKDFYEKAVDESNLEKILERRRVHQIEEIKPLDVSLDFEYRNELINKLKNSQEILRFNSIEGGLSFFRYNSYKRFFIKSCCMHK